MLINRFQYKITRKFEEDHTGNEFAVHKKFIQSMKEQLPQDHYQTIINIVNEIIMMDMCLIDYEAHVIKIIESIEEELLTSIPFVALANMSNSDYTIKNIKEFYTKNPDCQISGGYFGKLAKMSEDKLKKKFQHHLEDKA